MKEERTVFISYSWKDGGVFTEQLKSQLCDYFKVIVDKDILQANDDIDEFMGQIADSDYIVMVLTKEYVKSLNCMYEASTLASESDWHEKAFILVVHDEIYDDDKTYEIRMFWESQYRLLKAKYDGLSEGKELYEESLSKHKTIVKNIDSFLCGINRFNNPSQITIVNEVVRKAKEEKVIIQDTDDNEHRILEYIKKNGTVSRTDIINELSISKTTVNRYVSRLLNQGIIVAEGMAQTRKYRIVGK